MPPDPPTVEQQLDEQLEDLSLVDDALEDEGKTDEEIFNELEAEEVAAAAGESTDDISDDESAAAAAAAADKPPGEQSPGTQEPAPDDVWASASPEQRAAHEDAQTQISKLEQTERSRKGRMDSMQRRIDDLARQPAPGAPTDAATATDGANGATAESVTAEFFGSEEWKSHEQEYPEVSGPQKSIFTKLIGRLFAVEQKQEVTDAQRIVDDAEAHDAFVLEQEQLLEKEHEDWEEVMAAKGTMEWLEDQPRHIQEAAVRNADEIVDAEQAADVISRLKAFRTAQSAGPSDAGEAGDDGGNSRLSGKRDRQLATASNARTGGAGAAHGIPEDGDEEAIWNAMERKEAREAKSA